MEAGALIWRVERRKGSVRAVSLHVAGRLGIPRLNVLPAQLFPGAPPAAKTIGLRPEHIAQGSGRAAIVTRVERLGDQTRLHLNLDNHDIITLTDVHTTLDVGDAIAIEPRNPLYFDADGARIVERT